MPYYITGTATFSSQANRDAARTRADTAVSGLSYVAEAVGSLVAGLTNPTTTTTTVSVRVDGTAAEAYTMSQAILNAWVLSNRHTSGWIGISKV
jgi:hypothetical protein